MDSFLAESAAIISYWFHRLTGLTNYVLAAFGAIMLFAGAGTFVANTLFLHWFPPLSTFWVIAFGSALVFAFGNIVKCIWAEWRVHAKGKRTLIVFHYQFIGTVEGIASALFIVLLGATPTSDPRFLSGVALATFCIGGTIMDFFSNAEI